MASGMFGGIDIDAAWGSCVGSIPAAASAPRGAASAALPWAAAQKLPAGDMWAAPSRAARQHRVRWHASFLHALGVQTYRNHGAVAHVVLDGYGTAGVFQILLHHGKPCSGSTDIALHLAICAGNAKVESALLVVDAGSLIGKADGVSAVQNRDDGLGKVRVDKVFDNLADDHERDVATLLFHTLVDGVGRLFQIRADILRLNDDHTRCRQHVVIDGDSCGVHGFWRLRGRLLGSLTLFAHAGDVLVVGCRVSGIDHGVKVVRHAARNLSKGFEQIVAHRAMFLIFRQLFKTC